MLSKSSLDFLETLMTSSGPSGFEFEPAAAFRTYAETFAHEVRTDVTGNTIAVLNPDAKFKVMLAGHYDEIGFQVVYIDETGLVFFRPVGGIDKNTLPGIEVNILNTRGEKIPGVIGRKPIHLQTPKERETPSEFKDLWIDIGAENEAEAKKLVGVGDPVAFRVNWKRYGANRIMSKGLDDKIGAWRNSDCAELQPAHSVSIPPWRLRLTSALPPTFPASRRKPTATSRSAAVPFSPATRTTIPL